MHLDSLEHCFLKLRAHFGEEVLAAEDAKAEAEGEQKEAF